MKEEKKWDYDFYSQRNSVFENQEETGVEKWEKEEMRQARGKKNNDMIENCHSQRCE